MQTVSRRFAELAEHMCSNGAESSRQAIRDLLAWAATWPENPERQWAQMKLLDAELLLDDPHSFDEALRKVLEAKDCAVRAMIFRADG
jgi:hypothetical protein